MNPMDDTLQHGETLARASQLGTATGSSTNPLSDAFDLQQTIRQQAGVGQQVFNRYCLDRVLGRGGMGIVWLATDTKLERQVALKFLPDLIGADPVALKELKEETKRGLDLAHPHIVRFYDFVDDGESAAISMEFVDGVSLAEKRLECPQQVFHTVDLAPWILQITDALDYAHGQRRIVHRDLKPANLMLDRQAGIKVADFGIARSLSDTMSRVSVRGSTSGTLLYMSPQQAMGERPRPTDDIYSLGSTLFELLAGKPPFYTGDISRQITTRTAPSVKDRREELEIAASEDIPEDWERVIADCLQKDPASRPQTAGEIAERLGLRPAQTGRRQSATKQHSTTPKLTPVAETPVQPQRQPARVPWGILAGAAVVVLAGIAGAGWWWVNRPASWELTAEPAGALITVNGKTLPSPAVFSGLKAGQYTATISAEGYEQNSATTELKAGQTVAPAVVTLARSTGTLELDSKPAGALYRIESVPEGLSQSYSGKTPDAKSLPVGDYQMTLEYGGVTREAKFSIERNAVTKQSIVLPQLEPAPAQTPPEPAPSLAMQDRPPEAPAPPAPGPSEIAPETSPPTPAAMAGELAAAPPAAADAPPSPAPEDQTPPAPTPAAAPDAANAAAVGPPAPPIMPLVEPEQGYWPLDEIFAESSYSDYSKAGRGYLLHQAQQKLKAGGHYDSSVDGKPGKGTHKAIQTYQEANSLPKTGRLDSVTLSALELNGLEDKSSWSSGPARRYSSSRPSSNRSQEEEKTKFRRGFEKVIGRDVRDLFKKP